MITIAVLSADKNSASLIGGYIRAIEGGEIDFCSVRFFENVIDFFGEYKSGFDIAIIDTAVPGMSGIQVVELIRNSGGELPVILISNTIKSAVSAIPYDVSAYLLKPLNEGEFHKALLSAVKRVDGQSGRQLRIRAEGAGFDCCCVMVVLTLTRTRYMQSTRSIKIFSPIYTRKHRNYSAI